MNQNSSQNINPNRTTENKDNNTVYKIIPDKNLTFNINMTFIYCVYIVLIITFLKVLTRWNTLKVKFSFNFLNIYYYFEYYVLLVNFILNFAFEYVLLVHYNNKYAKKHLWNSFFTYNILL